MRRKKGKFIVFEGIDGAGSETQSRKLFSYLKKKGIRVLKLRYPDYRGKIGRMIKDYLYEKINLSPDAQLVFYLADILKDKRKIENYLKRGYTIVSDRYITSTLAYQGSSLGVSKVKNIIENFSFPKPDMVIYLKVSVDTSFKRKKKEKKKLDRNEVNKKFLKKVSKIYEKISKNSLFGKKWVIINGEKSKKEVFEEIRKKLKI